MMLCAETIAHKVVLPHYTQQQLDLIHEAIAAAKANAMQIDSWTVCRPPEGYIERDGKIWAVYSGGRVGFELPKARVIGDDDTAFEYVPIFVDGRVFRVDSLDGESGMLALCRCVIQNREQCSKPWFTTLVQTDCIELS